MSFLSSLFKRPLVGLDIGVSGIKAVELSGKKSPRLIAYNRIPLPWDVITPDGEVRKREVVVEALKKLFAVGNFGSNKVAVGIFGRSMITKKVMMPKMTALEVQNQLYWEAEQYIPFNVNEVNLDFAILGDHHGTETDGPMMDVLIVAAKKDFIEFMRGLLAEADLEAAIVDSQAFALGNVFEFNYGHLLAKRDSNSVSAIVDFGAGSTKVSMVEGDKTTFTRELQQSGIKCTRLLSERLGVSLEEAERLKILEAGHEAVAPVIREFCTSLCEEISRTVDFFLGQSPDRGVEAIYVCGGSSKLEGLTEVLETRMGIGVEMLNPIQNIAGSGRKMNATAIRELAYLGAVGIGLSLREIGDSR